MISPLFLLILLYSTDQLTAQQATLDSKCLRAAVYEHIAINEPADQPLKVLNNNLLIYERVIKRASFIDAKIIVLPEYSFLSPASRDVLLGKGVAPISPELNVNLCAIYKEKLKNITQSNESDLKKSEELQLLNKETVQVTDRVLVNNAILRKLSCLASENNIYIAANLITIESKHTLQQPKSVESASSTTSTELDALSQSDQLINDKLTEQLNKINKHNLINRYEDYLLLNTEIVMDNQGKLIDKYHNYNLYAENAINRTDLEVVTFSTPFGKFGLATCSDILFEHPIKDLVEKEKIDHLIFSSEWRNDLPSLTGFNVQAAASVKYKINLLSAGKRNFPVGQFGTGIYNGKIGVRAQTSFDNHDRLLVADLPTGSLNTTNDLSVNANEKVDIETMEYSSIDALDTVSKVDVNEFEKGRCSHFEPVRVTEETFQEFSYVFRENTFLNSYKPLQTPIDLYKTKRLENTEGNLSNVCDSSFCCELEWNMNDKFNFVSDNYFLAVISRLKQTTDSKVAIYEQNCALISYHQSKPEYKLISSTHFDKLILRGKFNTTEIYPTVLSSALYLVPKHKWNFKQVYNEAELSFENIKRPITFVSLYGRVYELDQVIKD